MNYGELKDRVKAYLHRTNLDADIPGFIELARSRINRDLRVREMMVLTDLTPTENPFTLPADFLEARELYYTQGTQRVSLRLTSRWQLAQYAGGSNNPRFYSIDGLQGETAPGGVGTDFKFLYYAALPAFVDDVDTNEVLTRYPSIYLYGALLEAHSYEQDSELQGKATEVFVSEVGVANAQAAEAEAGAALQMNGASQWV